MYHVPCTIHHIPCTTYHVVPCATHLAPCTLCHARYTMYHVPCTMCHMHHVLCIMQYALRTMPFPLCRMHYALCSRHYIRCIVHCVLSIAREHSRVARSLGRSTARSRDHISSIIIDIPIRINNGFNVSATTASTYGSWHSEIDRLPCILYLAPGNDNRTVCQQQEPLKFMFKLLLGDIMNIAHPYHVCHQHLVLFIMHIHHCSSTSAITQLVAHHHYA